MKPITFKEKTKTLHKPANMTDEECAPLDVYCDGEQCISVWRMSWTERISALFFGKVWLSVVSGETQPPVALTAKRTVFNDESSFRPQQERT